MQVPINLLKDLGDGSHFLVDCCILGFLARHSKIYNRMRERVNTLWFLHCKQTGDPFVSLENGTK